VKLEPLPYPGGNVERLLVFLGEDVGVEEKGVGRLPA
jgi:hypothetical protein